MPDRYLRLTGMALFGALPLMLYTRAMDVVFGAWRAAEWAYLGCAFVLAGGYWLSRRRSAEVTAASLPWVLFGLWVLVATLWSVNVSDSFRRALELAGAVAALWFGAAAGRDFRRTGIVVIFSAGACSLYGLVQTLGLDPLPWATGFGGRSFGTLGNPNYYAGLLLLVIPLAGAMLATSSPGPQRGVLIGVSVLFLAGFLLSQVRGAWLAGAAAAGWASFWLFRRGGITTAERRTLVGSAGVVLAAIVVALAISEGVRSRLGSIMDIGGHGATGRRYLWAVATNIWLDRWATGFGTGSFRFEFPRFQHIGADMGSHGPKAYAYSEHAHSEVLQFGAELGSIGVGFFLWGLVVWGLRWSATMRALAASGQRDEWWLQLGLGTGIFGLFAYGWVNLPLQVVPTAILWWGFLGISLSRMSVPMRVWRLPYPLAATAGLGLALLGAVGATTCGKELIGSSYLRRLHGSAVLGYNAEGLRFGGFAAKAIPHDHRVFMWLSRIAVAEGKAALVDEMVAVRLRLHPHRMDALHPLAQVQRRLGRADLAEARYRERLAKAPNFVVAWSELGKIYFEAQDYHRAVDSFERAVGLDDGNSELHHNLAAAYGMLKMYREALEADSRAIERDPGFIDAYIGLALSARALGEIDRARAAARQAYTLNPSDGRSLRLLRELE